MKKMGKVKYKWCKEEKEWKCIIDYFRYKGEARVPFSILKAIGEEETLLVHLDTRLLLGKERLAPEPLLEVIEEQVKTYGFYYKAKKTRGEVYPAGLQKLYKSSVEKTVGKIMFIIEKGRLDEHLFEEFLAHYEFRIGIGMQGTNAKEIVDLFYMEDLKYIRFSELFQIDFYDNAYVRQTVLRVEENKKADLEKRICHLLSN